MLSVKSSFVRVPMKSSLAFRSFAVFALLTQHLAIFAQDVAKAQGAIALQETISAKELPDGYKPYKVKTAGTPGIMDSFRSIMPFMMMGGSSQAPETARIVQLVELSELIWSKGEMTNMWGTDYILAYRLDVNLRDVQIRPEEHSGMPPMKLQLVMIKPSEIVQISPDTVWTKENLAHWLEGEKGAHMHPGAQSESARFNDAQTAAKQTQSLSNIKQMALGLLIYAADYDDLFPAAQSTKAVRFVIYPYVKNLDVFRSKNPIGSEFNFNTALSGVSQVDIPDPVGTVLLYEPIAWPDGTRVVAFADGHAKKVNEQTWSSISKTLKAKFKRTAKKMLPADYGVKEDPLFKSRQDK